MLDFKSVVPDALSPGKSLVEAALGILRFSNSSTCCSSHTKIWATWAVFTWSISSWTPAVNRLEGWFCSLTGSEPTTAVLMSCEDGNEVCESTAVLVVDTLDFKRVVSNALSVGKSLMEAALGILRFSNSSTCCSSHTKIWATWAVFTWSISSWTPAVNRLEGWFCSLTGSEPTTAVLMSCEDGNEVCESTAVLVVDTLDFKRVVSNALSVGKSLMEAALGILQFSNSSTCCSSHTKIW